MSAPSRNVGGDRSQELPLGDLPQGDGPEQESNPPTPDMAPEEAVRVVEALLFSSDAPITAKQLATYVGDTTVSTAIEALESKYDGGVRLIRLAGGYALRTAPDLDWLFEAQAREPRKLSRAALETLAIIAYHQPVTRAEIEDIRGVAASKGTLDVLLEAGWVRMRGRRRTPGRPVTYGTTPDFLDHFTLDSIGDLPGLEELRGAGLLETVPDPNSPILPGLSGAEKPDEDPMDEADEQAERASMALWPSDEDGDSEANEPGPARGEDA